MWYDFKYINIMSLLMLILLISCLLILTVNSKFSKKYFSKKKYGRSSKHFSGSDILMGKKISGWSARYFSGKLHNYPKILALALIYLF